MPRGRDFTSLATQAAGANNEQKMSGLSIDGSTSAENRVVIDGVETTNTLVGTPGQYLVTDFVEELQVKSSGYSAEYGGSTGGVLNAITRTGSNAWHGDALLYWSGDALDAGPRRRCGSIGSSRAEYVNTPRRLHQLEPGFTLGGPIVRDKLWFFAGYVPSFRPLDRSVTFLADGRLGRSARTAAYTRPRISPLSRRALARAAQPARRQEQWPPRARRQQPRRDYSVDDLNPNLRPAAWTHSLEPRSEPALYFFNDF
jgi:hypothetical protein